MGPPRLTVPSAFCTRLFTDNPRVRILQPLPEPLRPLPFLIKGWHHHPFTKGSLGTRVYNTQHGYSVIYIFRSKYRYLTVHLSASTSASDEWRHFLPIWPLIAAFRSSIFKRSALPQDLRQRYAVTDLADSLFRVNGRRCRPFEKTRSTSVDVRGMVR